MKKRELPKFSINLWLNYRIRLDSIANLWELFKSNLESGTTGEIIKKNENFAKNKHITQNNCIACEVKYAHLKLFNKKMSFAK